MSDERAQLMDEAAAEILRLHTEVKRLKHAILSFGRGNDFDWNVLQRMEEQEQEIERLTLRWTDKPPTEPGWYWYTTGGRPQVVLFDGEKLKWVSGRREQPESMSGVLNEWSGPIHEPADAQEPEE